MNYLWGLVIAAEIFDCVLSLLSATMRGSFFVFSSKVAFAVGVTICLSFTEGLILFSGMFNLYKSWQFRQETFQLNGVHQQRDNVLLRSAVKFINESP